MKREDCWVSETHVHGRSTTGVESQRGTVLVVRWRPELIESVRRLGHRVAVVYAPAEAEIADAAEVDYAAMVEDASNVEQFHGAVERMAIPDLCGILNIYEWAIVAGAYVAQHFGVPTISPATAVLFRDKHLQKLRLHERGVVTSRVELLEDVLDEGVMARVDAFGYPAVIKPLSAAGAALTYRVDSADDVAELVERARADRFGRRVFVVEEFQEGQEWHVDGFVVDGSVKFLVVSCYDQPEINVHNGHLSSSRCFHPFDDTWAYDLAEPLTREALAALGLETAVFHLECFYRPETALVFGECAARSAGGAIVPMIQAKFGVELNEVAAALAAGARHAIPEPQVEGGVHGWTFLPSVPGRIEAMPTEKELLARPGVLRSWYRVEVGEESPDITVWTASRVGEVLLHAPDVATYDALRAELLEWFLARFRVAE